MTDKILFSADAFGTFGAMNGNIFADEVNFERDWLDDARRYYTNIVGKFGTSVQTLLKKAAGLDIQMICPLHGPVWRENISWYVDKYLTWSSYAPEERAVMIAYGSIYGNTENAANILACRLADRGVRNIAVYDVSSTHPSVLVSEAFRCSHLVFASVTYNGGIFTNGAGAGRLKSTCASEPHRSPDGKWFLGPHRCKADEGNHFYDEKHGDPGALLKHQIQLKEGTGGRNRCDCRCDCSFCSLIHRHSLRVMR